MSNPEFATNIPNPDLRRKRGVKESSHHNAESATKKPLGKSKGGDEVASKHDSESATKKSVCKSKRDEGGSNHYKTLQSWEADLALGDMARHGPVLYAIEKLPDKLKSECKP